MTLSVFIPIMLIHFIIIMNLYNQMQVNKDLHERLRYLETKG